jgi:hypothetical protein
MFSNKLETTEARQIAITRVIKDSPADGNLKEGDVILGVSGKPFSHDPRVEFARALTHAESEAGKGNLSLTRWRDGKTENVVLKIQVLGSYSATAPYECPKSKRIFEQGCEALAQRMKEPRYPKSQNAITRSLNALALLASGNREYLPLVRREAEWASGFSSDSFQTWWYAYTIMLLAEYQIATSDATYSPGMERLALEAAKGQSMVGSWGHKFAAPDGRLHGYGMMNAPGVPLTISLIMARQAGLKDPALDLAIDRWRDVQPPRRKGRCRVLLPHERRFPRPRARYRSLRKFHQPAVGPPQRGPRRPASHRRVDAGIRCLAFRPNARLGRTLHTPRTARHER